MTVTRKAFQGLAFILVIALLIGLAFAKYVGAFDGGIPVTLKVDRIGNQLATGGDVKVRGLIVGSIKQGQHRRRQRHGVTVDRPLDGEPHPRGRHRAVAAQDAVR